MHFIHCFQSEWLKKKRSLASWLVVIGAFFTPCIIIIIKLYKHKSLKEINSSADFWEKHWMNSWESMAILLIPLGIILSASLITQLEFKNNTWKQWHTTPQHFATIFFAKLAVIIVMMLQFLILFNLGIYLSAVIPGLVIKDAPYPVEPIPYNIFAKQNINFFISCLPIIGLQYLISLQFRNFLVPVGAGIVVWIASVGSLTWKYTYIIPYTHSSLFFLKITGRFKQDTNLIAWATGYFIFFTLLSYLLYVTKKEKG